MATENKKSTSAASQKKGSARNTTASGHKTGGNTKSGRSASAARSASARRSAASKKEAQKRRQHRDAVITDLAIIAVCAVGLLLLLSLFGVIGSLGSKLAAFERGCFGSLAFLFPFFFLFSLFLLLRDGDRYMLHTLGRILLLLLLMSLMAGIAELIGSRGVLREDLKAYYRVGSGKVGRLSGGFFGGFWCRLFVEKLGKAGCYILLFALLFADLVLLLGRALLQPLGRKGAQVVDAVREENRRFKDVAEERRLKAELRIEERELERARAREEKRNAEAESRQDAASQAKALKQEQERAREAVKEETRIRLNEVRLQKESLLKQEAENRARAEFKAEADRKEAAMGTGWQQLALNTEDTPEAGKALDELLKEMEAGQAEAAHEKQAAGTAAKAPVRAEARETVKPVQKESVKKELFTDDLLMSGRSSMQRSDYVPTGRIARGYSPAGTASAGAADGSAAANAQHRPAKLPDLEQTFPGAAVLEQERREEQAYNLKLGKTPSAGLSRPEKTPETLTAAPAFTEPPEELSSGREEEPYSASFTQEAEEHTNSLPEETEPWENEEQFEDPRVQLERIRQDIPAAGTDAKPAASNRQTESIWAEASGKERESSGAASFSSGSAARLPEPPKAEEHKEYRLPDSRLLVKGKSGNGTGQAELKLIAHKLEETLSQFGVSAEVTDISCGPAVTRFELKPEQGVRVGRIASLADDIKFALAVTDVRIEAPIPGKSAVGIEVPNREKQTVYLRDLVESPEFQNHKSKIAFAVGQDIAGHMVVGDIAKMPHMLIAGSTGSGKSVMINSIILSILYRATPEEVQLLMIDPKVVELQDYNGIPHLRIPVVTDPKQASEALQGAVKEMTSRYKRFADMNVRDIKSYNAKLREHPEEYPDLKPLPQMVVIVDEFADLMMVAAGDVEQSICRLAQLARAAGIHLILATQRPSANVITGLIKANVQSRIAFAVSSGLDSRIILDMNGAEKLLGKGDMLFFPTGYPKPVRVQGCFVSDEEIASVTDFWKKQGAITQEEGAKLARSWLNDPVEREHPIEDERDELFVKAAEYIIDSEKASIGNLQRVFRIGFNRAARLMDQLAEAGIVGPEDGTKARAIMLDKDQFADWKRENGYE